MIRLADFSHKSELSKMWQSIFLEDYEVTDYFFEKLFESCTAPVLLVENEIAASLFLLDCQIGEHRGKCVYCAMTKYAHRGKGYMKRLLDFSYDYCLEKGFDFLVLVPAEKSLFDYYKKCGFENFGIRRRHIFNGVTPKALTPLDCECHLSFSDSIKEYWESSCVHYGGTKTDFGLVFYDDTTIIRNGKCDFDSIPVSLRKSGNIIEGDLTFGESESPAMIKCENEKIKNINCYIGITLE